jgi:predicted Zn-dependent protease
MSRPPGPDPARLGLAALIACAYIGASAWLIRGQGEAYRTQLREERSALAGNLAPSTIIDEKRVEKGPPPPTVRPPESVGPSPVATRPAEPPAPTEERKATPAPSIARAPEPPAPASPAPASPVLDPFWEQPDQKKVWDVDHLTTEDERRLGEALHQMVLKFHRPVEEGPLPRRVEEAAEPFLKSLSRDGLSYTFTVLDCDESNAFSHPGGYVYVCKGIFDWIAEDEDYALGFLLAHEIAHVDLDHALECLRDPEVRAIKAATVPLFYSLIIPWGYKEEQDFAADRWAWKRMNQAGSSRREVLAFLRKLEDHAERNGYANLRKRPPDNPRIAPLDHHLRSHPIPRSRLKTLLKVIDPAAKPG